jgi:hypothetical protein
LAKLDFQHARLVLYQEAHGFASKPPLFREIPDTVMNLESCVGLNPMRFLLSNRRTNHTAPGRSIAFRTFGVGLAPPPEHTAL